MTATSVSDWFDGYNDTFGACARGDKTVADVLAHYDSATLITLGETVVGSGTLAARAWVEEQAAKMRTADYSHTEMLDRTITVLNPVTALLRGDFSRRSRGGIEVSAFTVTYLIYRSAEGLKIGSLAIHS